MVFGPQLITRDVHWTATGGVECGHQNRPHSTRGALEQLNTLIIEVDRAYPGAPGLFRAGMEATLTATRARITGTLKRTLRSTNPCESICFNGPRHPPQCQELELWSLRRVLKTDRRRDARSRNALRKFGGYRQLVNLAVAIERDLIRRRPQHSRMNGGTIAAFTV